MAYTPTKVEQETILRFDESTGTATVYTASPVWMRRMGKLIAGGADITVKHEDKIDGIVIARTYELPKSFIKVRPPRVMSEKQKEVFEKMQRMNSVSK